MRHRATTPSLESKRWEGEEKGTLESKGFSTLERKTSKAERIPKSTSKEFGHNAGNILFMDSKKTFIFYFGQNNTHSVIIYSPTSSYKSTCLSSALKSCFNGISIT